MSTPNTRVSNKTYFGVQALRAVAALLVVVHHSLTLWVEKISGSHQAAPSWMNGTSGVDIFFVTSGFVMAISAPGLAGQPNKASTFLWRRLIRVAPLYWVFTTAKILMLVNVPSLSHKSLGGPWHVVASYLFVPSFNSQHEIFPILEVGWTLNFEMLFYLLFAAALAFELPLLTFLAPVLGALAWVGTFAQPSWPAVTSLASPLVLEFFYGVLLGHFTLQRRLPGKFLSGVLFAVGLAAILTIPISRDWRFLFWGVPAAAIVTAVVATEEPVGKRLPGWLLEAGNASYSLYLAHTFLLSAVGMVLVRLHGQGTLAFAGMLVFAVLLCLAAGECVHRLIELPLLRVLKGKGVRGVATLPVAPSVV